MMADPVQRFKSLDEIGRYELFLDLYHSKREEDRELFACAFESRLNC